MTQDDLKKILREKKTKKYRRWVKRNSKKQKGGGFGIGMAAGMALPLLIGFLSKNKKLGFSQGPSQQQQIPVYQPPPTRRYQYPPPPQYYPPPHYYRPPPPPKKK